MTDYQTWLQQRIDIARKRAETGAGITLVEIERTKEEWRAYWQGRQDALEYALMQYLKHLEAR